MIKRNFILLVLIAIFVDASVIECNYDDSIVDDTYDEFEFDVNLNGHEDCILYKEGRDGPNLDVIILTQNKNYHFNIIYPFGVSISDCGKGCLHIMTHSKQEIILDEKYYYSKKYDFWFTKENLKLIPKYSNSLIAMLGIGEEMIPIDSLFNFENKLSKLSYKKIKMVNKKYLDYYLNKYSLKKNLTPYNNIAYYLQKVGSNKEAVYLLEKIIAKYPNRTVAYYNLGDAYWALGDKKKAKEAYTTYIEQMCDAGKQKRIPKVVKDRVSSK